MLKVIQNRALADKIPLRYFLNRGLTRRDGKKKQQQIQPPLIRMLKLITKRNTIHFLKQIAIILLLRQPVIRAIIRNILHITINRFPRHRQPHCQFRSRHKLPFPKQNINDFTLTLIHEFPSPRFYALILPTCKRIHNYNFGGDFVSLLEGDVQYSKLVLYL